MNENEINREVRLTRKLLLYFDKQLEELINLERLTGMSNKATSAVSPDNQIIIELSKERRALIRQLHSSVTLRSLK